MDRLKLLEEKLLKAPGGGADTPEDTPLMPKTQVLSNAETLQKASGIGGFARKILQAPSNLVKGAATVGSEFAISAGTGAMKLADMVVPGDFLSRSADQAEESLRSNRQETIANTGDGMLQGGLEIGADLLNVFAPTGAMGALSGLASKAPVAGKVITKASEMGASFDKWADKTNWATRYLVKPALNSVKDSVKLNMFQTGEIPTSGDTVANVIMDLALTGTGRFGGTALSKIDPKWMESLTAFGINTIDEGKKMLGDALKKAGIDAKFLETIDPTWKNSFLEANRLHKKNLNFDKLKDKAQSKLGLNERFTNALESTARTEKGYDISLLDRYDNILDYAMKYTKEVRPGQGQVNLPPSGYVRNEASKGLMRIGARQKEVDKIWGDYIRADKSTVEAFSLAQTAEALEKSIAADFGLPITDQAGVLRSIDEKALTSGIFNFTKSEAKKIMAFKDQFANLTKKAILAEQKGAVSPVTTKEVYDLYTSLDNIFDRNTIKNPADKGFALLSRLRSNLSKTLDEYLPSDIRAAKAEGSALRTLQEKGIQLSALKSKMDADRLSALSGEQLDSGGQTGINILGIFNQAEGGGLNSMDAMAYLEELDKVGIQYGIPEIRHLYDQVVVANGVQKALKARGGKQLESVVEGAGETAQRALSGGAGSNTMYAMIDTLKSALTKDTTPEEILQDLFKAARDLESPTKAAARKVVNTTRFGDAFKTEQ